MSLKDRIRKNVNALRYLCMFLCFLYGVGVNILIDDELYQVLVIIPFGLFMAYASYKLDNLKEMVENE